MLLPEEMNTKLSPMVQEELVKKDEEQATKDHARLELQPQSLAQAVPDPTRAVYNCLQQPLPKLSANIVSPMPVQVNAPLSNQLLDIYHYL